MKETKRNDIPPFLLDDFHKKAMELRNMLLMFRFRRYKEPAQIRNNLFPNIKGRLRQTLLSITSVIRDEDFLSKAQEFAQQQKKSLKTVKGFDLDAIIYQILKEYCEAGEKLPPLTKIVEKVKNIAGIEKLSSKAVGCIVRDELGFETKRFGRTSNYVVILNEEQLNNLQDRYESEPDNDKSSNSETPPQTSASSASSALNQAHTEVTEHTEVQSDNLLEKEKELRKLLVTLDKNSPEYASTYKEWFYLREEGVKIGIFKNLIDSS